MDSDWEDLVQVIRTAANGAANALLGNGEHFYYFSLITSGEAHSPIVSAWSWEALDRATASDPDPEKAKAELKWSYADSPYMGFGENDFFRPVVAAFSKRPPMQYDWPKETWQKEYDFRFSAMEEALRRVDAGGAFGTGLKRDQIAVLVEVMPPDSTNADRARRLNGPSAIAAWLEEAAED